MPVESSALVVFAGRKLNFGGCLLSKGLWAAWLVGLEFESKTCGTLDCICVPLGLPKVVAAEKGFGWTAFADMIGFGLKDAAAGLS